MISPVFPYLENIILQIGNVKVFSLLSQMKLEWNFLRAFFNIKISENSTQRQLRHGVERQNSGFQNNGGKSECGRVSGKILNSGSSFICYQIRRFISLYTEFNIISQFIH